ncbi:MAG TPA: DUF1559 domain-containing protein [Pirellulales bacterium]|nr:DUF1559 domain-containing protein [Pirellulales bacterium]
MIEERGRFQFGLGAIFVFVTFAALFTALGQAIGLQWLFLSLPVCLVIGVLGATVPRPTMYGIVLGGIFVVVGTLIVCSVARTREEARRIQCTDNLKEIGMGFGQASKYFPVIDQADSQRWVATQSQAVQQGGAWRVRHPEPLSSERFSQ